MTEASIADDRTLAKYLLGQLSDDAMSAIEERYFQDDEYFARLEGVADDLAADYVRGRLTADDRLRFERGCLQSRDDRLRLRLAAAMSQHAARNPPPRRGFFQAASDLFGGSGSPIRVLVPVGAMALIAGCLVLGWQLLRLQQTVHQLREESAAARTAERAALTAASEQSGREKALRESLEARLGAVTTVAFTLFPGVDRGFGRDLAVTGTPSLIRFDLALDPGTTRGQYRVLLQDSRQKTVSSQDLRAQGAASLAVTVPVAALSRGDYEIHLLSVDPLGRAAELAIYGFSFDRR